MKVKLGKKWVKSCLTINSLSIYCCFFHDNFNLDLNPLFSSELRIEAAAASFNSQLLSHVFVRGCWKHQLLFCCRYCLPAMLPRDHPRFFDLVEHQTTYAYIGNKHFFTKLCHLQTYQNYEQSWQKLSTFLEN